jgi:hypothetical protein
MAFENPIMVRTGTNTQQLHGRQTTENLTKGHVVNSVLYTHDQYWNAAYNRINYIHGDEINQ